MAETSTNNVRTEQKLILAVIIDKKITVGGGFNQAVNAAQQMIAVAPSCYDVRVLTRVEENVEILREIGLQVDLLEIPKRSVADRIKRFATSRRKNNESISPFEKEMMRQNVALVYFTSPSPSALELQTTPFIFTIWDLCHLEHPEFPEVCHAREFEKREELFSKAVAKAFLTITDSEYTTEIAKNRYGGRFLAVPFAPAPFMKSSKNLLSVLEKYQLEANYLFYPAQFWAHKNHVRLLEAAAIIKAETGAAPKIVFSGGEQGHKKHIETLTHRLGLEATTRFLGFVPPEEVAALYDGSLALVMPSYFGPSNLPPLEAWSRGKPVLYPKQFVDFVGDAALLFDPDDAASLAESIGQLDTVHINRLRIAAEAQLSLHTKRRLEAERNLVRFLEKFAVRTAST
ncbi:glycosyltransferase [uncultured Agrobacterium sp.]|uniref:glycosyltransferase n=1 Tax=uncultured Agrobacterium sp. TaxID=157277 RepID=UPI0025F9B4D2|nr:glycosyltransferase [uncultured Agrobacterium sp.]